MRKIIKNVFVVVTIIFVLCFTLITPVHANNKEYEIESANFDVEIDKYGNATVTETWEVDYQKGQFSRFFKNIYVAVPVDEEYDIDFESVRIDGKKCDRISNKKDADDYTYCITSDNDTVTYEIFIDSENEVREFEITYVLSDVVKCVDDDYYLFKYRFLPLGYKTNIEQFEININLPDNFDIDVYNYSSGDLEVMNDCITISDNNVSDLFKVCMRMEWDGFDKISSSSHISSDDVNNSSEMPDFMVAVFIAAVLLFTLVPVLISVNQTKKYKKMLAEDPGLIYKLYSKWVPRYFTHAEFLYKFARNNYLVYFVYLAEMASKQIIKFDEKYETISYPISCHNENYYFDVLAILDECRIRSEKKGFMCTQDSGYWIMPTSYIETYFKTHKAYDKITKTLKKYTEAKLANLHSSKNEVVNTRAFSKDRNLMIGLLGVMIQQKSLPCFELSHVISQYDQSNLTPLFYCYQGDWEKMQIERDESAYLTVFAVLLYSKMFSNSSSSYGCSSCSSCSSCGGCGGCGGSD